MKLESNQKVCENQCPKCGAGGDDIDWGTTDIEWGNPSTATQTATCRKCGTDFCECLEIVYQYTEITGDIDDEDEHDPDKCGCKYLGNDMWSCGHIDNESP